MEPDNLSDRILELKTSWDTVVTPPGHPCPNIPHSSDNDHKTAQTDVDFGQGMLTLFAE